MVDKRHGIHRAGRRNDEGIPMLFIAGTDGDHPEVGNYPKRRQSLPGVSVASGTRAAAATAA